MPTATGLVLGWKVNDKLQPIYWQRADAKVGQHGLDDLEISPAEAMAHHSIIVAQSGGGKSFFLGRLVEEILLKTKSRVVILDPNSDFRQAAAVRDDYLWDKSSDLHKETGQFSDEATRDDFFKPWERIKKRILIHSARGTNPPGAERLEFNWLDLSSNLLRNDEAVSQQSEMLHCHEFLRALAAIHSHIAPGKALSFLDLLNDAREHYEAIKDLKREEILPALKKRLGIKPESSDALHRVFLARRSEILAQQAAVHLTMMTEQAARFYFSTAYTVEAAGLVSASLKQGLVAPDMRLDVIDLPSVADRQYREMVVGAYLEREWASARLSWERAMKEDTKSDTRVPTFIVVDEAHHLIPTDGGSGANLKMRDLFRMIAAEGRKFGVFLVLVSQRPDKLDGQIVSECENRALMRVNSDNLLGITNDLLGLDQASKTMASSCLNFGVGRALLVGPWAGGKPKYVYGAARRTIEGGRNLRKEYWAEPYPVIAQELPTHAVAV